MPIYEFRCKNCGNVFEYLCIRKKDRDDVHCPQCGSRDTETLLSTFSSVNSGSNLRGTKGTSPSCSPSAGFS